MKKNLYSRGFAAPYTPARINALASVNPDQTSPAAIVAALAEVKAENEKRETALARERLTEGQNNLESAVASLRRIRKQEREAAALVAKYGNAFNDYVSGPNAGNWQVYQKAVRGY